MNPFRQLVQWFSSIFSGSTYTNIFSRLGRTAILWSWGFNILRLASVVVLLPLLTRLPHADFGFYYLLLSIVAVTPLIDMGFSSSVDRAVSYAMAGARELRSEGLPVGESSGRPNFDLFWKLVHTARLFYRLLTLLLLVLLGTIGSYIVSQSASATSSPLLAWLAWFVALLNAAFEVYSSWWNTILRGMNQVVTGTRILCLGYFVKVVLSCVLLLLGCGVLSIFGAGLISSALIRSLSRAKVLRTAAPDNGLPTSRRESIALLKILWPNSWRIGLQLITSYLTALLLMLICKQNFTLAGAGQYGFSLNIAAVIQAIASVWVTVKWPAILQLRSRNEVSAIQKLFWGRLWLATLTFLFLGILALLITPVLLKTGGFKKELLPSPWFAVLLLNAFLETQMIIWGTFMTIENKVPTLWPIAISNALTVGLVLILLSGTSIQLGAFALAPLIIGLLFNYWYWAVKGPRSLGSTWLRYMFRVPQPDSASTRPGSVPSIA